MRWILESPRLGLYENQVEDFGPTEISPDVLQGYSNSCCNESLLQLQEHLTATGQLTVQGHSWNRCDVGCNFAVPCLGQMFIDL